MGDRFVKVSHGDSKQGDQLEVYILRAVDGKHYEKLHDTMVPDTIIPEPPYPYRVHLKRGIVMSDKILVISQCTQCYHLQMVGELIICMEDKDQLRVLGRALDGAKPDIPEWCQLPDAKDGD